MSEKVEFWFDPSCPWTWITSRWLVEVSTMRDIDVVWRAFSLWELNKGRELDPGYREKTDANRIFSRITAAVAHEAPQQLGEFYTVFGTKVFDDGAEKSEDLAVEVLESIGLNADLAQRAKAGEFDEYLAAETQEALDKVGNDVGVPIISVADVAFFGPVISPAPHGEDAGKLWDGTLALAQIPGFFELKRSRDVGPIFS